jgi:hypothetical protein
MSASGWISRPTITHGALNTRHSDCRTSSRHVLLIPMCIASINLIDHLVDVWTGIGM